MTTERDPLREALKESRDYLNSHLGDLHGYRILERAVDAYLRAAPASPALWCDVHARSALVCAETYSEGCTLRLGEPT